MAAKTGAALRREQIMLANFAGMILWLSEKETGYCAVPRTLPLIMALLDSKEISGKKSPSSVYVDLLSRHRSEGVIEMGKESDHAFSAGYQGPRAIRTWRERMKTLEKNGFIVTKKVGNEEFAYVALVHPTVAVQKLINDKRVSEDWLAAYRHRQLETKEPTYDKLLEKRKAGLKVVSIAPAKTAAATAKAKKTKA
jgi:hypothetical protein